MTTKAKNSKVNNNRLMIIIGMVVVAIILVLGFIFFQSNQNSSSIDYSNIPQGRTDDGAFILGSPDAAITIVAWEDFLCPHCQEYQSTLHRFFEDFVTTGKARFEFRMLPISQTSPLIFGLAECAGTLKENSFWDAYDTMFSITEAGFSDKSGREFANVMGLSYSDLLSCASNSTQYVTDEALARSFKTSDGQGVVTGTPTLGWRLNGGDVRFDIISRQPTYQELAALIEVFGQQK